MSGYHKILFQVDQGIARFVDWYRAYYKVG